MRLFHQRGWVGSDINPNSWLQLVLRGRFFWVRVVTLWSSKQDIFSGEINYTSPVSPERIPGIFHLMWPWSHFISNGSLFSLVWYPYQVSKKCWRQIPSPSCDVNQILLFASVSAPPPFQPEASSMEHEVSSFSGARHIRSKLPIPQELWRYSPSELLMNRKFRTHWKVELTCMLEAPDAAHGLSLVIYKAFTVFTLCSASPLLLK